MVRLIPVCVSERRSGFGFTKVYQVPGTREDEDVEEEAEEYDIKRAAKESQVPNQIVST